MSHGGTTKTDLLDVHYAARFIAGEGPPDRSDGTGTAESADVPLLLPT